VTALQCPACGLWSFDVLDDQCGRCRSGIPPITGNALVALQERYAEKQRRAQKRRDYEARQRAQGKYRRKRRIGEKGP
jgi:hypothetical protein